MTCPECARREAESAARKRRDARWNSAFLHTLAGVMVLGGLWMVAHGRWRDPAVAFGAMFGTYYVWCAVAWLVRRRRARRRTR